jgi:hypothetical protein
VLVYQLEQIRDPGLLHGGMHQSCAGGCLQPTRKRNPPDGQEPNKQPARHGLLNNEFPASRQPAFEKQQEYGGEND